MSHPLDEAIARIEEAASASFKGRSKRTVNGDGLKFVVHQPWWSHADSREMVAALRSYIAALRVLRRERDSLCTCPPLPSPEQDPKCPEHCDGRETLL